MPRITGSPFHRFRGWSEAVGTRQALRVFGAYAPGPPGNPPARERHSHPRVAAAAPRPLRLQADLRGPGMRHRPA